MEELCEVNSIIWKWKTKGDYQLPMNHYEETFDTWNKIASHYEDKFMYIDLYNESYDAVCAYMEKENTAVLEIGCGPGNITKYLLSKRPDLSIFGIDIAPNMIELAQKNNPSARFEVMDSRGISKLTSTYDAIVCGFCIPYLSAKDCEQLISDSADLLTENGLIYVSFVEGDPSNSGFQVGSSGDRIYFHFHELNHLESQLAKNKFQPLKMFRLEYKNSNNELDIHTVLIAKKQGEYQ